jgi:two-component system LytT family sensor kinase
MNAAWYNSKVVRIATHILIWMIALSLPYLLYSHHDGDHGASAQDRSFFSLNLLTDVFLVGPFYLNAYLLTPRLFNHKQYLLYAGANLLVLGVVMVMHAWLHSQFIPLGHFSIKGAAGFLLPTFLLVLAISTTFSVVKEKMREEKQSRQRQEENLKTELSFLRSQINPHFIFNILNNLVALERMKSPELGPTILKLSGLMQYMLYETDEENVRLTAEVDYLQSYIDLQRQRFGEKVDIHVCLKTPGEWHEIEPMLLIPFVENAFKHGVGMIEHPTIRIDLHTVGNVLHFSVKNKYNDAYVEVKDKTSGIGLTNVKRRLNLLYGDQHSLLIAKEQDWFTVSLQINLH